MRDLTKSLGSFSWAMSLFGVQQLGKLMSPSSAAAAFDAVTDAAEHQLGDALRSTFRLGDRLQRSMMDMAFGRIDMNGTSPDRWADAVRNAAGEAAGALRGMMPAGGRAGGERGCGCKEAPRAPLAPIAPISAAARPRPAGAPSSAAAAARAAEETGWGPMPSATARRSAGGAAPSPAPHPARGGWGPVLPLSA